MFGFRKTQAAALAAERFPVIKVLPEMEKVDRRKKILQRHSVPKCDVPWCYNEKKLVVCVGNVTNKP